MGKSGPKLKAALQSQQRRFKVKEKLTQAAQTAEQKSKKKLKDKQQQTGLGKASAGERGKSEKTAVDATLRPTVPFRPTDRILLIGEGNFSFTRALVQEPPPELLHLPPQNITATAYDTQRQCYEKYPEAEGIVKILIEKGVEVRFGVDATRLEKISFLKRRKWDKIVWNFPHAGKGITDQDRNILSNQVLLLDFLKSAAKMLVSGPIPNYTVKRKKKRSESDDADDDRSDGEEDITMDDDSENKPPQSMVQTRGTVLITLRNVPPYTLWDLPRLAKKPPPPTSGSGRPNPIYTQLRSFTFVRSAWKGYEHRMTKGERAHGTGRTGEGGEDRTWEFCLRD
ncbi:hypothetical protein AX16_004091 [Volvariella volvacea WC 439]|nr:hypothetical protein AX16_004091 [Volvariella volvacea WC 439]